VSGNAATTLALTNHVVQTASLQVLDPTSVTLGNGGIAGFAFVVTNTGNAPELIHFVGSPSTWQFVFLPANVSLGTDPSNRTASAEVTITIPSGTPVDHPTIQLEAVLASGKPAGFASPLPTVTLTPVYGIFVGSASVVGAAIAPYQVSVPFYVRNTGTVTESVHLSVADSVRLAGLGWTTQILTGRSPVGVAVSVPAAANQSYTLQLTSPAQQALPPGSATVSAAVLNGSGPTATVALTIPAFALGLNSSSIIVTGPSIGAPSQWPDWLVPLLCFVPAIALVAFLLARRYLKTRQWDRR
ncbi:MAG TPA: hypothetical protein VIZ68_03895, partial [Thermoplasmata archaeon]